MASNYSHQWRRAEMSSMEPNNNNFKKHSCGDEDLMPVKDQVYFGKCYKNISRERERRQS